MLFNSFPFILIFLPYIIISGYFLKNNVRDFKILLVGSSLLFYGYYNFSYLSILIGSVVFNYFIGNIIKNKPKFLIVGIACNLALLGYFKYMNFFIDNINEIFSTDIVFSKLLLPLAISFFTFQQISYLVDTKRGEVDEHSFLDYFLFVCFFPQLIAGPIVHHKEIIPQFNNKKIFKVSVENVLIGVMIFSIGLFKKVVIADGISDYSDTIFNAASNGETLSFIESWLGVLSYSFQIYFDFSGYSDMAIGIAKMFGIRLPINFFSPYRATSIIDFWRRWHITLSRFLRDYLYIPLGGGKNGAFVKSKSIIITMLLGGLWHGASWNFIVWGGLHGTFLVINHLWRKYFKDEKEKSAFVSSIYWFITFTSITIAWVFFRAENIYISIEILQSMFLLNNSMIILSSDLINISYCFIGIVLCFFVCLFMPNVVQFFENYEIVFQNTFKDKKSTIRWSANVSNACAMGVLGAVTIIMMYSLENMKFLYFDF